MDNVSLVTTALKYYDQNNELHKDTLKRGNYIKFMSGESDLEHKIIIFYDKDKKEFFRSRYEVIGVYNSESNTWTWSWSIPTFKKNNTNIARKLWNYGALLDPSVKYLKTELITSRFRVANPVQLDIHIGIAAYLSKNPLVYKHSIVGYSKYDIEGFTDITESELEESKTIYYMFLLDHKNAEQFSQQSDK